MKKYSILAIVAIVMAVSCQKANHTLQQTAEPVLRTFTCTIDESVDPETRLAISETDGKTTWEVGDEILIHGKATDENVTVILAKENISADKKTATFSVSLPANPYDPDKYYAAYPASAYIEYSSNRGYYYNTFNETNLPLMSAYLSGDSFIFFNLCGAMSFVVDGDFDQYILQGNNDETVGYDRYQVKITSGDKNYCRQEEEKGTMYPKKTVSAAVDADGVSVNRVFFPNGVSFSSGFTINFLKSGSIVKTLSTTASVSVPRNSYRPMGDVTSYLKDFVAPATHDSSIDTEGATALDASANANCYIVDGSDAGNADKVFIFKAYKGNSSASVGTVASAEILWETWNNAESITANSVVAAVDFEKKADKDYYTMVFKTPATLHAGNALIAAKDAGGNILWSWHIWVPSTAITTGTFGLFTRATMDRNLGALCVAEVGENPIAIESLGMYYQWGRKDPFRAAKAFDSTSKATVPSKYGDAFSKAAGQLSVEEAIANPTKFGVAVQVGEVWNNDWNSSSSNDLWGNVSGSKTIYDPCPVGYKVPKRDDSEVFYHTKLINGGVGVTGWSYDSTKHYFTAGDPVAVFPLAGKMSKSGSLDGHAKDRGHYWNAKQADNAASGCAQYIYYDSGSAVSAYSWNQEKAIAGSIRCIAE